ncbi:class I SAM-dependent methyltransferase [Flavisericum labens]|uniref:class I SAM-dependent methyltransferase n=1 Tax=Flavisericum labens TaxID=3377112 RepID=UPI00387ADB1E
MYNSLKKTLKAIVPKKFLFKNEMVLRKFYGFFYLGKNHQCNICDHKLKSFIVLKNGDLLCPFCGSLSRNRRLWAMLNQNNKNGNWLHFSPSRSLYRKLKANSEINYFSTDFEDEFLADFKFDITKIDQENEKFDSIICYHILEHIENDDLAMKELYRVLKPNGKIYIQTPFKDGEIYEDKSIITPKAREKHFGQNDHVRIYSVEGLKKRLESNNLIVEAITFEENDSDLYYGLDSPETIIIARKQ